MIKLRINYEVAVQCQDEGFTIEDCQMLPGGLWGGPVIEDGW